MKVPPKQERSMSMRRACTGPINTLVKYDPLAPRLHVMRNWSLVGGTKNGPSVLECRLAISQGRLRY
ncbi:hypothetical protein BAUCODRAFT_34900 [Baudoinia panamericana UAMH 10762]|uniref:Uncharacterized protein n=1 Tax=Baudoinia panamericana (strain UAMH 10762) TaxID=717646 RepID=M2MX45_BAUPA|nr:uncharacterized protein BAUCODRAFT_34900 [Baudoinia panamericana UAMH 10762]EMC96118.1 hypothetical protein BAUCODRAFT_34900 [Baudoinia panamericana UAMH 10762]